MGKLNKKLKAATLIESLIAMIIIVVCLGVGTMIYSNVLNSDKQRLKLKAILMLNEEAQQIKTKKIFLDGEKTIGDYVVKVEIKKFDQSENLHALSLTAINKEGVVMGSHRELIFTE